MSLAHAAPPLAGPPRPFRRFEYDRMVELGFFAEERVELIEGTLVTMSPQSGRHATSITRLTMLLVPSLIGRAEVRVQLPFAAGDLSEPEPDLAVVPRGDYVREHPSQAFLVAEVGDDSLEKDRRIKARLYAAAGVLEYWIVNLRDDVIEVHRSPDARGYTEVTTHGGPASLSPAAFPDITLRVADIIPAR